MEIGTDILQNNRFIKSIQHKNGRLRKRLFTVGELSSNYSDLQYALIFSAKEAISKALKTGFNYGLSWQHINIVFTNNNNSNNIEVTLSGKANQLAGNKKVLVTASQNNKLSTTVALLVEGD